MERFLSVLGSAASAGVRSFRVVLKNTETVDSGKDASVERTSCNVSERSKASLTCLSAGASGRRCAQMVLEVLSFVSAGSVGGRAVRASGSTVVAIPPTRSSSCS